MPQLKSLFHNETQKRDNTTQIKTSEMGRNPNRNRVKSGNRCRINVESMSNRCQIDPGETDLRVRSGGSVPNKPLTILA